MFAQVGILLHYSWDMGIRHNVLYPFLLGHHQVVLLHKEIPPRQPLVVIEHGRYEYQEHQVVVRVDRYRKSTGTHLHLEVLQGKQHGQDLLCDS